MLERLDVKKAAWNGQAIFEFIGTLADIDGVLPTFRRSRFTHEGALNEYLDLILREPHGDDDRLVPVATVSRRYALIQHRDVVGWMTTAFKEDGWDPEKVEVLLRLSEYGERMFVGIEMPGVEEAVRPGDRVRAEVRVWNSVDRSQAFEVTIGWRRLICSNGLTAWEGDRMRKIHHVDWMSSASPVDFIRERLPKSRERVGQLRNWTTCPITDRDLVTWIDGPLTEKWGKGRAARVLHISRTGRDCSVGRFVAKATSSQLAVHAGDPVPGAPTSTTNIYDLYQTLLWIAGRERAIEERETKTEEALDLVRPLLPEALQQHAR
jgi:hypothetical protein